MKKLISILLVAMLIISMIPATVSAAEEKTYVKVTETPSDWSGDYLIVYEDNSYVFDGSLATLDATSNYQKVTITDNEITCDSAYQFTIAKSDSGYTIKSSSGNYIGRTSDKNGLDSGSTEYTNTIDLNADGTVSIKGSAGPALQFNSTSGQTRFRYFKSTQKAICLYRLDTGVEVEPACEHPEEKLTLKTAQQDATCTQVGYTAKYTCECGEDVGGDEIAMIDHNYVDGACTICGESEPAARFKFGDDGDAGHKDGSAATEYTETFGDYTLTLSDCVKVFTKAYDEKGNSCIKLGTGSAIGGFSFTVPAEVAKVIIYVAGYKGNTAEITVNGASNTVTELSNNGEYAAIEVDTSSTKTVTLTTASGGYRAMVNTIEFYAIDLFEDAQGNGYPTVKEALRNQVTVLKAIDESTEMPFDVTADGTRYIGLADGEYYTYHSLDLKLTGLNLRAGEAGIYYRAKVTCDDTLAAAVDSYGIVLSTNDMPGTDIAASDNAYTTVTGPVPVNTEILSGSVFNIFKDGAEAEDNRTRGTTGIFATVYLNIDGNIVVATQEVQWSLQKVLQTVDAQLETLAPEAAQKEALCDFYKKWAVDTQVIDANVEGWNLANIAALYTG